MQQTTHQRASASVDVGHLAYQLSSRALDVVVAGVLLVLLAPVLVAIAVAIRIDSGLPIIYACQRLGRDGRLITVLKFRTMRDGSHGRLEELLTADEERRLEYGITRKLRDDPRCTRVGRLLRRASLDELPQLWNVLIGDMTLVGPRPYFPDELAGRPEGIEIISVRPGMTGLWQVSGRSDRTFEERLSLEITYVRTRSLALDSSIAWRTLGAVVSGRGAY